MKPVFFKRYLGLSINYNNLNAYIKPSQCLTFNAYSSYLHPTLGPLPASTGVNVGKLKVAVDCGLSSESISSRQSKLIIKVSVWKWRLAEVPYKLLKVCSYFTLAFGLILYKSFQFLLR